MKERCSFLNILIFLGIVIFISSCKKAATTVEPTTTVSGCDALTGSSWTPNISGVSDSNHNDSGVAVYKTSYTGQGLLTGLAQSYDASSSHVITFSGLDMSTDLLSNGSVTLVAEAKDFPTSQLTQGNAYPVLISLNDGTNELVNISGCTSGFYTCPSGNCAAKSGCGPDPDGTGGSAFLGVTASERRTWWDQYQHLGLSDYTSVNVFPTCNWSSGSPSCAFATSPGNFFSGGKLRTGTYTAKYILLASNYSTVGDSYSAGVKLTIIRKKDGNTGSGSNGALDINVIFVGNKVINQSRTDKGKQNLDALFTHVYNHYYTQNSASTAIKLGTINVYEWTCENGGDSYATISTSDAYKLFQAGSAQVSASTETKAVNIFLATSITYTGTGTVLGMAGGIPGAMVNGTGSSGAVFASLNKLSTYNPNCTPGSDCSIGLQEAAFIDMGSTVSHEMGHFLGLNHPRMHGVTIYK
ncbi:MAG: hypothetical protein HY072_07360 [Deltaproteobacteria bacterium]|nr:hypothetical protein [Deltaproteobacteria bacterium]